MQFVKALSISLGILLSITSLGAIFNTIYMRFILSDVRASFKNEYVEKSAFEYTQKGIDQMGADLKDVKIELKNLNNDMTEVRTNLHILIQNKR